jgi:predicted nucleic acid-binding protein
VTTIAPTPPFRRSVPSPGLVLDVGIPESWLLTHQGNLYTSEVMTRVGRDGAIVPATWPVQLAGVARASEARGQKSGPEVDRFFAQLCHFPIRIDDETSVRAWSDTLNLSRSRRVSVFDAAYLELALRFGLPLATVSRTLRRAAAAAGVPLFTP